MNLINSSRHILLAFVLMAFTTSSVMCNEAPPESEREAMLIQRNLRILRGDQEFVQRYRESFNNPDAATANTRELSKVQSSAPQAKSLPEATFLFERYGSVGEQNIQKSQEYFTIINNQHPPLVHFNERKLIPFDEAGVCTAMALDFAARFLNECTKGQGYEENRENVKAFGPYYRFANATFKSKQAAYNTINVEFPTSLEDLENGKEQKIQSLANFHDIQLTPVTRSVKIREVSNDTYPLAAIINSLPDGTYVIRALHQVKNHKMESYGHTMVFCKNGDFSIFFDNSVGAAEIHTDVGEFVAERLLLWWIPEIRIYHAVPKGSCCSHLSTEI